MNITQIKETILYIRDLDRSQRFYHDLLGLPIISRKEGNFLFLRAGTSVLLLFIPEVARVKTSPPGHYAYGKQHIAFEVPLKEYKAWRQKLESSGITITATVQWGGGKESFYFNDPDGHVLEILMPKIWEK